jgi:hypothetical protein
MLVRVEYLERDEEPDNTVVTVHAYFRELVKRVLAVSRSKKGIQRSPWEEKRPHMFENTGGSEAQPFQGPGNSFNCGAQRHH